MNVLCLQQHVAKLGSSLQSAQQRQVAVTERLDTLALDLVGINSSLLNADDMITSLNLQLTNLQAAVNHTVSRPAVCVCGPRYRLSVIHS